MALLLVKAVDALHPDATKDRRGTHKRGDVCAVYLDAQHDGDTVTNPVNARFVLVKVTDLPLVRARRLIEPDGTGDMDAGTFVPTRRHAWQIDLDALPARNLTDLIATRYTEITWTQLNARVAHKTTGGRLP